MQEPAPHTHTHRHTQTHIKSYTRTRKDAKAFVTGMPTAHHAGIAALRPLFLRPPPPLNTPLSDSQQPAS